MDDEKTIIEGDRCACGRPSLTRCGDIPGFTVIRCAEPVCGPTGLPTCGVHRHRPGTMGFISNSLVSAELQRFTPDGPGLWDEVKNLWANHCTSIGWKANRVLKDHVRNFPPPAPLPQLKLVIQGRVFTSNPSLTRMNEVAP